MYVVFFVSKSLLGIERQKKLETFTENFTRKPRSHVMLEYWYIECDLFPVWDVPAVNHGSCIHHLRLGYFFCWLQMNTATLIPWRLVSWREFVSTSKAGYSEFSGSLYVFVKLPAEDVKALENTRVIKKEKPQEILLLRKKLNTVNYRDCVARL